jgi:hypothetical protein
MLENKNDWNGIPNNPEKEGYHWLRYINFGRPEIQFWGKNPYAPILGMCWVDWRDSHLASTHYKYLGPVLTPEEVEELKLEISDLERDNYNLEWNHQRTVELYENFRKEKIELKRKLKEFLRSLD